MAAQPDLMTMIRASSGFTGGCPLRNLLDPAQVEFSRAEIGEGIHAEKMVSARLP